MKNSIFIYVLILSLPFGVLAQSDTAEKLDKDVVDITDASFVYNGQKQLTEEESKLLLAESERKTAAKKSEKDCPPDGKPVEPKKEVKKVDPKIAKKVEKKPSDKKGDWQVVFVMRISKSGDDSTKSTTVTPEALGTLRAAADTTSMIAMAKAGTLTPQKMNEVLDASAAAMKKDPMAAMAYVAALGDRLADNYGDSKAGKFVTAFEQYGRMATYDSTGQCSDIHYAMLRAYKQLTGNPKAKAFLVNFQTGKSMHHTDLVIEEGGQLYVVNYGQITSVPATRNEALRQNISAGYGLAYRVFGEDTEERDKMVAHIDTPMGMFLREVSTGTSSYNPFQNKNYSLITGGIAKSGGTHVQLFFGELGGGDVIAGVAVNLAGAKKLPAGFTLESHLGGAIAYAHKKFATDTMTAKLNSEILYINTGLGLVSPQLNLGNFSFSARTDVALEGGVWLKQFSDGVNKQKSPVEGDVNIVSQTKVVGEYKKGHVTLQTTAGIELMPSFATAFPRATDGSSADGLVDTLGILPTRVTVTADLITKVGADHSIFLGSTYMHTPLGGIGEIRAGVLAPSWVATAYLRGALDRDRTPAFVPGAGRSVGVNFNWCSGEVVSKLPICIGGEGQKSLEDNNWFFNGGVGSKF